MATLFLWGGIVFGYLNQDGRDERMGQDRGMNQDGKEERMGQDLQQF